MRAKVSTSFIRRCSTAARRRIQPAARIWRTLEKITTIFHSLRHPFLNDPLTSPGAIYWEGRGHRKRLERAVSSRSSFCNKALELGLSCVNKCKNGNGPYKKVFECYFRSKVHSVLEQCIKKLDGAGHSGTRL